MSDTFEMDHPAAFNFDDLRAFEAVVRLNSFSRAADAVGMAQSSVSQRINRLEADLRRPLIKRTTRQVSVTEPGRVLLIYANAMLGMADQARRHFEEPPLEGVLRLGVVEDFMLGDLHRMLSLFRKQLPRFALSLRSGLSVDLFRGLDEKTLDVVLAKRTPGRSKGVKLWSEPLVWVGDATLVPSRGNSVPLAIYPHPSVTRELAIGALRRSGLTWTVVAESKGIAGLLAAAESGFGISVFSRRFVPACLDIIDESHHLPTIGAVEYVIDQESDPDTGVGAFVAIITETVREMANG